MPATRVVVNIPGEDAYNVRVGAGVLDALGSSMRGVPVLADARQVLVITDANVGPLYLARAKVSRFRHLRSRRRRGEIAYGARRGARGHGRFGARA